MKKTLVALAALAAAGAYAQSSVTLDGYFDRGYTITNNSNTAKSARTVASSAGTTTIGVAGVEDLGGGMKMGFRVNTDWAEAGGFNQQAAGVTTPGGAVGSSQSYIEMVSASMGTLRLGNVNSEMLTLNTNGVASPTFSTGIGSAYSSSYSGFLGYGNGATDKPNQLDDQRSTAALTASAGARHIRQTNTIKYFSPNFNGFSVAYGFAPKVDIAAAGKNLAGITDLSLGYANGPLAVMFAQSKVTVGANAGVLNGTVNTSSTNSLLGVSYVVLPGVKLHAGFGTGKTSGFGANDANVGVSQYGVTYTTGAWDLMGQLAKSNDKTTRNYDRKMTGVGVNYNFSKTARAYLRYDNITYNVNQAGFAGDSQKRTAIGISKSF
jgi:predicted porin